MNEYTPFSEVYDYFLAKINDDMYLEFTELDTYRMLEELLMAAVHKFEFPRVDLTDFCITEQENDDTYDGADSDYYECPIVLYGEGHFNSVLTREEENILATYMAVEWIGQQLANVENTRMKYSGSDFKFTSQANHMSKLQALKQEYEREGFHLQRLYKRRKRDESGLMRSQMNVIMDRKSEFHYDD